MKHAWKLFPLHSYGDRAGAEGGMSLRSDRYSPAELLAICTLVQCSEDEHIIPTNKGGIRCEY